MEGYVSIARGAQAKIEIKKSIFIADAAHVTSKDEAEDFIAGIRKAHPEARHCCFAYVLCSGGLSRASDDGEPQGTAGLPMLEIIKKNGMTDVAVTVTRYFGGILLGAPGLVRAYGAACAEAIKLGGVCKYAPFSVCRAKAEYADFPKLESELRKAGARAGSPEFSDAVTISFSVAKEDAERLFRAIADATGGRAKLEFERELLLPENV